MIINTFVVVAVITYLIMLAAFFLPHLRRLHITVMVSMVIFDLCVPFYLMLNRDFKARLIDSGDILSFGVWMHFGLVVTLYILYFIQIQSAFKLLRGDEEVRAEHHGQGKAILAVRAFVILTGAMLIDPEMDKASGSLLGN